jgi:hypothetical protein
MIKNALASGSVLASLASVLLACGSSGTDDGGLIARDSGSTDASAGSDGGPQDAMPGVDAQVQPDAASGMDATITGQDATTPPDTGMMLTEDLAPGSHVTVPAAQLDVTDTYAMIKSKIGAGTRSTTVTRTLDWMLNGFNMTIWFANTNLSTDRPPNDIHDTDKVLWIAVSGAAFTGKTPNGIGIGSSRMSVEAASPGGYGPAPHTIPYLNQTIAQYYHAGFLAAYDATNSISAFTVCDAYKQAPDGTIDHANARLSFQGAGDLQGTRSLTQLGTHKADVITLLGQPDGEGMVAIGGQQLHLMSYGFIGIEVFSTTFVDNTLFFTIHAPYYGSLMGGGAAGVGSTRTVFEAALNLGMGHASTTPNLYCYTDPNGGTLGVTYSGATTTDVVTSITMPLPQCP